MNITTLLNRKPSLLVSATKLTSLVLSNNRQEIQTKSLLLRKRKEISKQRIRTFAGLQADANRGDIANNALLGGGLAAAISQGDGRWWAIPLGAVVGSHIGCDIDGG